MRRLLFDYLSGISSADIDIKAVRNSLNLTQERFAGDLHVSLATVRRWEKKKTKPSPLAKESIRKLAKDRGLIE